METIKISAANRLAKQLHLMGFEYMIVHNGEVIASHGNFTYDKPVKRGVIAGYVDGFIKDMEPGDTVRIPYGEHPPTKVTQSASSRCHLAFGKGNYMTKSRDDYVEVLCLDRDDTI